MKRKAIIKYGLVGLIIFHLIANIFWLSIDSTPPAWDHAAHIRSSVTAGRWLTGVEKINFSKLIDKFGAYPPLIYFITGIFGVIFNYHLDFISFVNTIFFALGIFGIYKLSLEFFKRDFALLAAVVFSFTPVIYDISRGLLLDLPLTIIVIWGLWFWIKSDFLKESKLSLGWWLMVALASLTKLNGPIYFFPMGIISLFYLIRNNDLKCLKNLFIGGFLWLLSVGWWWLVNWGNIYYNIAVVNIQGEPLTDPMNLLNWQTWIHYLRLFVQHQFQPIPALIFLGLLGIWLTRSKNKNEKSLTWWLAAGYIIFTIVSNKDFRYTMPLLAAVAVITAGEIGRLKKKWSELVTLLLFGFWGVIFINNSYNWPIAGDWVLSSKTFLIGDVEWLGLDDYPVRPAKNKPWPNERLVRKLYDLGINKGYQECLMVVNWEEINDNNLLLSRDLYSINGKDYFNIRSTGLVDDFSDEKEIKRYLKEFNLIVVPEQGVNPGPFYIKNLTPLLQLTDWVWTHPDEWEKEMEFPTPRATPIYLFRRI